MNHFVVGLCTHEHISVTKLCIVIYGTCALWELGDYSIGGREACRKCAGRDYKVTYIFKLRNHPAVWEAMVLISCNIRKYARIIQLHIHADW